MSLAEPRRARYRTAHCFGGRSNRIGHDPFDGDAEVSVAGERGFQVGEGAVRQAHQPSNIILTLRARPSGVSLAFLCMFI